jgi:hypothetical protein
MVVTNAPLFPASREKETLTTEVTPAPINAADRRRGLRRVAAHGGHRQGDVPQADAMRALLWSVARRISNSIKPVRRIPRRSPRNCLPVRG